MYVHCYGAEYLSEWIVNIFVLALQKILTVLNISTNTKFLISMLNGYWKILYENYAPLHSVFPMQFEFIKIPYPRAGIV
jgi:hypothetical protein